jgi:predicted Zn-dependent peptidase
LVAKVSGLEIESARRWAAAILDRFAREPMPPEELHRAVQRATNVDAFTRDAPILIATSSARRQVMLGKQVDAASFAADAAEVTAQDVLDFARRNFTRHAVAVVMPAS